MSNKSHFKLIFNERYGPAFELTSVIMLIIERFCVTTNGHSKLSGSDAEIIQERDVGSVLHQKCISRLTPWGP